MHSILSSSFKCPQIQIFYRDHLNIIEVPNPEHIVLIWNVLLLNFRSEIHPFFLSMRYLKNVLFLSYPKLFLTQPLFAKLLLCHEILDYFQTNTQSLHLHIESYAVNLNYLSCVHQ